MRKKQYMTKQMKEILVFFESAKGQHVTIADICDYFEKEGVAIGTTTVYRNVERLVNQGIVAKYVVDGTTSACFEYLGTENPSCEKLCYHCKCEICGKVIHLECHEVQDLGHHIFEHHGFQIDYQRTVFYGICDECSDKAKLLKMKL